MQNLKASKCGVEEARNGNTLLLQHTINKFKELSQDISYKARNFEETICQWKVVTNCTAQIKLHEKTPSFPLDNFDINLDLHDSSQSSECICLMFALSRYVEKRLQTKRLDNLVGNENAWGSHTLEDIATNGEHAKSLGEASPPYKVLENYTACNLSITPVEHDVLSSKLAVCTDVVIHADICFPLNL